MYENIYVGYSVIVTINTDIPVFDDTRNSKYIVVVVVDDGGGGGGGSLALSVKDDRFVVSIAKSC